MGQWCFEDALSILALALVVVAEQGAPTKNTLSKGETQSIM
jgi:hypothetical protein